MRLRVPAEWDGECVHGLRRAPSTAAQKVTGRRTNQDFAVLLRELMEGPYAAYDRAHVVLDNLSTDSAAATYFTFPPAITRGILRRIIFH